MADRSSKRKKKEHDSSITAFRAMQQATGQAEEPDKKPLDAEGKNPAAVALGRLGGLKVGKARAEKLTPNQRSEIAKRAAQARWYRSRPRA